MVQCHNCGDTYTNIGNHWGSTCPYPSLSTRQDSIIKGLMLGDGSIGGVNSGNPYIQVEMCNEDFLNWVKDELGILSTTVRESKSREDQAQTNYDHGYSPHNKPDNYSQAYRVETRRMPAFNEYQNWYMSSRKTFPDNVELDPLMLSVWYACDGTLQEQSRGWGRQYITIGAESHGFEKDNIILWFDDIEVEPRWQSMLGIRFTCDDSEELIKWMEGPLPGFEYKWIKDKPEELSTQETKR